MRILLVSWEYPPVIEGGLGRHVAKLSQQLAADGHEVHVLTRGSGGDAVVGSAGTADPDGPDPVIQVHRVEIEPFELDMDAFMEWVAELNAKLARAGERVLAEHGFDLVHSHDWLVAEAAERLAAGSGLPWLVTVHATEFGRHNGWVHTHPQRAIHLTERRMVRRADAVVTCSEYMRGHVCRVFGVAPEHVVAIPNGIDAQELEPAAGTDLISLRGRFAGPEQPLVLMLGRLVYEKGFHVALQALARAQAAGTDLCWLLAGTGTAEADLAEQAATLGLTASGRLLGRINDQLLHALYRVADVVVVPSLYEPFGIVPLEAMAAGCPVIVSRTGGLREVVPAGGASAGEGTGTLNPTAAISVSPGDADALAAELSALLADPDRRAAMAAAGRAHVRDFDWSTITARTAAVYESLAAAPLPA